MFVFNRKLALAVALAGSAALGVTGMAAPAHAAKKEKKQEAPGKNYSKEFVAAFSPLSAMLNDPAADVAALQAALPGIEAAASTADDRAALGQALLNIGQKAKDLPMQRRGVAMMLDSGNVDPGKLGVYNFLAGQLAYQAGDWATVRTRVQAAMDAGYSENNPQLLIAESYFNEDNYAAGLGLLDQAVAQKIAANQAVPEEWLKRGLAMSYQGNLAPQSTKYSEMYAQYYPSKDSWGDAIAIQRNFYEYEGQDLLDLLRLARRTQSLRNERDYVEYINTADARRLPGEVEQIIDAGVAAGLLRTNDSYVNEVRTVAAGRVKADRADLPGLERDARAANVTALTATAAGDAFLSYEEPAKAEEFYKIALTRPGVDTPRVLTRLGIAQLDQGKTAEAQTTFAKVEGARQAIARLWGLYAAQKTAPAVPLQN